MVTTQTQIRRDTATNLSAATPVVGELAYDITNKRICAGDATTAGGIPHVNFTDQQTQKFIYGTVGGTANAITLTNSPPVAAYVNGLRLRFKATANNSGAVTVNVDGLGAVNVYKITGLALTALTGNEIISGGIYELNHDGTQFQLGSGGGGGGISDRQTFTSSGTWTKPTGYHSSSMVLIECIGAGGGGASNTNPGANGGDSSMGSHVVAHGGSGGATANGGAAGGYAATATAGSRTNDTGFEGFGGGVTAGTGGYNTGGGGGGGSSATTGVGMPSVYGGGGGGANSTRAGGASEFAGAGGNAPAGAANAPGGGGAGGNADSGGGGGGSYKHRILPLSSLGSTETITIGAGGAAGSGSNAGSAGARGEVRVTVFG